MPRSDEAVLSEAARAEQADVDERGASFDDALSQELADGGTELEAVADMIASVQNHVGELAFLTLARTSSD